MQNKKRWRKISIGAADEMQENLWSKSIIIMREGKGEIMKMNPFVETEFPCFPDVPST